MGLPKKRGGLLVAATPRWVIRVSVGLEKFRVSQKPFTVEIARFLAHRRSFVLEKTVKALETAFTHRFLSDLAGRRNAPIPPGY